VFKWYSVDNNQLTVNGHLEELKF